MKKVLFPLLFVPALAFGQASFGHLDSLELARMRQAGGVTAKDAANVAGDTPLTMFMRVSDDATVGRIAAAGASIDQREGNILVVTTTLSQAEALAATEGVVTVSLPKELTIHGWNSPYGIDSSREVLGLGKIHDGAAPFSQAYTGKGVVVGVIDAGIDVHHAAFRNPDGTHRVTRAWKHVANGKAVATLTADTEAKIAKFGTDNYAATHGTHVMGVAAGSFDSSEDGLDLNGAAPGAEIAVSCGVADTPRLLKGARLIADYAKSQNRPCVINISMGNNDGPHDGTDELPAALEEIASQDDVTIFISSGNEGGNHAFMYRDFAEDASPLRTFIAPSNYTASVWPGISFYPQAIGSIVIWSGDDTPVSVGFDVVRLGEGPARVLSSFNIPDNGTGYLCTPGALTMSPDMLTEDNADFNAAYSHSYIGGAGSIYKANNRYRAEISFQLECPSQAAYESTIMALRIEGKPGQKVYVYGQAQSSVFPYALLGGGHTGYTTADDDGSINSIAGAPSVITVGAYCTHNFAPEIYTQYNVGETAPFSSWGHTPDGRLHPLINAPGALIVSAMSSDYVNGSYYDEGQVKYYSYTDAGKTNYWTPMSGTSMASPYMAGVAAVWLEADPTLTSDDILRIAQETADKPSAPQANDGAAGHLNAYAGLCEILNLSGLKNVIVRDTPYSLCRDGNVFSIQAPAATTVAADVYSLQGSKLLAWTADGGELTADCSSLTPGIYVLAVTAGGDTKSEKIVIR